MYGAGLCKASGRSTGALVTESAGKKLGSLLWNGKSYVFSDNISNAKLGMYDIMHI